MANITELIKNIREAILGKDVRESIAGAIEQCYEDASKNGNANMEVTEARGTFDTLNQRLNNSDIVKAEKKEVEDEKELRKDADSNLQTQINSLASGSPLVASSTSEMTDTSKVYVNTTDGHWYYYNKSNWVDGGIYQATEDSETVSKLVENLETMVNDIYTPAFIDITNSIDITNGSFAIVDDLNNGKISNWEHGAHTQLIKVKEGEQFKITGNTHVNVPLIVFYSGLEATTEYYNSSYGETLGEDVLYTDELITIPPGVVGMVVNTAYYTSYAIGIKKYTKMGEYTQIGINEQTQGSIDMQLSTNKIFDCENTQLKQKIILLSKNEKFEWKNYDKAYITIRVDDIRHDVDLSAKIVNEYGFPLCIACIAKNMSQPVDGITSEEEKIGNTKLDVMKNVVLNGGEILNHPPEVIEDSDEENLQTNFIDTKYLIESEGFKVRGVAVADSFPPENIKQALENFITPFYDYSDGYGVNVAYNSSSTMMGSTSISKIKSLIDDAVTNKKWLTLVFHTLDGTEGTKIHESGYNEQILREELQYIKNYVDNGQLEVVTWNEHYNKFASNKLENRVKEIENKLEQIEGEG